MFRHNEIKWFYIKSYGTLKASGWNGMFCNKYYHQMSLYGYNKKEIHFIKAEISNNIFSWEYIDTQFYCNF